MVRRKRKTPRVVLLDARGLAELDSQVEALLTTTALLSERIATIAEAVNMLCAERQALSHTVACAGRLAEGLAAELEKRSSAARKANATRRGQPAPSSDAPEATLADTVEVLNNDRQ